MVHGVSGGGQFVLLATFVSIVTAAPFAWPQDAMPYAGGQMTTTVNTGSIGTTVSLNAGVTSGGVRFDLPERLRLPEPGPGRATGAS